MKYRMEVKGNVATWYDEDGNIVDRDEHIERFTGVDEGIPCFKLDGSVVILERVDGKLELVTYPAGSAEAQEIRRKHNKL